MKPVNVAWALVFAFLWSGCFVDSIGRGVFGSGGEGGETTTSGGMGGTGGSPDPQTSSTGGMGGFGGENSGGGGMGGDGGSGGSPPVVGPCGPIPPSGLFVCWVYDTLPVPPNQFVGLAGGTADPDQGETIEEKFLDPWCVNPNMGEPFVLCDLGPAEPNWNIQFRGGLHIAPSSGTITGTWDCSTDSCGGQVYVYEDGTEIGSMISDVVTGVITVIPHFNPPGLRNVRVNAP
jgi:hypothetical protein